MKELQIYDGQSDLMLPSGRILTTSEMSDPHSPYYMLVARTCVITINNGVLAEMKSLDDLKDECGVTVPDNSAALEECIRVIQEREDQMAENAAQGETELEHIHARLNEQAEAIMELASIITEGE